MVPATIRHGASNEGLQPLRLARDWRQVITLIEVAFGKSLDVEARRALHSMRPPPLLAPLIGLLDGLALPGEGVMPGFVWRDGGRVVGTASVRRIQPFNHGWLISNVAVHPDQQGRGIGRALMEAAIDYAEEYGAAWIVLQVRDDNPAARQLYAGLGFEAVDRVVRLRKAHAGVNTNSVRAEGLRPARWSDGRALSSVARKLTPYDVLWADNLNRALFRTDPISQLSARLRGQRCNWWVWDESDAASTRPLGSVGQPRSRVKAAVGVEVKARTPWHRLRLLIPPEAQDEALAAQMITFGLAQLTNTPRLPIEIEHLASDKTTQSALANADFEPVYALVHMRLNL